MQIRPWIKRDASLSALESQDTLQQDTIKLVVFISSTLSLKAKSLVQQIIAYINLSEQELRIIPIQEHDFLTHYQISLANQIPLAILVLGFNKSHSKELLNFSCPVLNFADPDYLISNPSEKRKVFHDLNSLKQLLS